MSRTSASNRSRMGHNFAEIPQIRRPRSMFRRTRSLKTAFDASKLIPVFREEVLPGDTHKVNPTYFIRMTTPIHPVNDNLYCDVHFFYVPLRLIWDNAEEFFGAEPNGPGTRVEYETPKVDITPAETIGSLSDYLGIPCDTLTANLTVNSFFHRAYNLIWNEWYRASEIQDPVTVDKGDGPDTLSNYVVLNRNKRHDYFTSALPFLQKGDPVTLPLGTSAPVTGTISGSGAPTFDYSNQTNQPLQGAPQAPPGNITVTQSSGTASFTWNTPNLTLTGASADLSSATAATINDIRSAIATQQLYEMFARGGSTRYTEILSGTFGVDSPDARLQRPEYLGGSSQRINFVAVPQTSATNVSGSTTEIGHLAAYGVSSHSSRGWIRTFVEHGVILGLASVRADLTYQQGTPREFFRNTRFDYAWPVFAHIGEQAIYSREIYSDGTSGDDDVFGYTGRYDEYRYGRNEITSILRSDAPQSLDYWHCAQEFFSRPTLNEAFIQEAAPVDRVVSVPSEPHFLFDGYYEVTSVRPLPMFGTPGLMRL